MLRIGAHMSVAGGVSKAVERAVVHGCEALQIFSKNANQWQRQAARSGGRPARSAARIDETGIRPVVSHASYLINLATTFPLLREQSIAAFVDELDRAEALGLLGVVIHPGTCTAGTEDDALRLIADAIRAAFKARPRRKTMVLLEHTAGQGRTLGHRFEHLAAILGAPERLAARRRLPRHLPPRRVGLRHRQRAPATRRRSRRSIASSASIACKVFHGNDSKKPCGSRVDRHEHIGSGCLGEAPFRRLLHDTRFAGLPILIETEKSAGSERPGAIVDDPFDVKNLETLRRLRRGRPFLLTNHRDTETQSFAGRLKPALRQPCVRGRRFSRPSVASSFSRKRLSLCVRAADVSSRCRLLPRSPYGHDRRRGEPAAAEGIRAGCSE